MRKETSSRDSDTHRSFSVKGSVIHSRGRQEALLLHAPSSSGQWHRPLLIHRASSSAPLADHYCSETIASYGTRCVVCDIRAGSFTGGTPFALSLNALRLPHAAKSSKITSTACHFGDRATVSIRALSSSTPHKEHGAHRSNVASDAPHGQGERGGKRLRASPRSPPRGCEELRSERVGLREKQPGRPCSYCSSD